MFVHNLASPEWVTIKCTENYLDHFVCVKDRRVKEIPKLWSEMSNMSCSSEKIKYKKNCFYAHWHLCSKNSVRKTNITRRQNMQLYPLGNISQLNFITSSAKLSPICSEFRNSHYVFLFNKFSVKYNRTPLRDLDNCQGYWIYFGFATPSIPGCNTFQCKNGVFISAQNVWNGLPDCKDKSDEIECGHNISCLLLRKLVLLRKHEPQEKNLKKHHHQSDVVIQKYSLTDCGDECEDEPSMHSLLNNTVHRCEDPQTLPCGQGYSKCYRICDICIYRLNRVGQIIPCRNGGHLENCVEFECNAMFKCSKYYCIPWKYVCDEKWDCPEGLEESSTCSSTNCQQMFKCTGRNYICLHFKSLCDKIQDCPDGDDEYLCEMNSFTCHIGCQCISHNIVCLSANFSSLNKLNLVIVYAIMIIESAFSESATILMPHAKYSSLIDLEMRMSCGLVSGKELQMLKVYLNFLPVIEKHCFKGSPNLSNIQLGSNNIYRLESEAFNNLRNLKYLNLSDNLLHTFPENVFNIYGQLNIVSLYENKLDHMKVTAFHAVFIGMLETRDFRLCCLTSAATKCHAPPPWYISCTNLLATETLRGLFVVISLCIILFNVTSLIVFFLQTSNSATKIIPVSINFSEIMCGIYLFIIWISDVMHKDMFVLQEEKWRTSVVCHIASGVFLYFTIADPVFLCFLSLSRLMVIYNPFDSLFKTNTFNFRSVLFIFVLLLIASFSTCLAIYFLQEAIPTGLCLYFVDPEKSTLSTIVLTCLITSIQLCAAGAICAAHHFLMKEVQKSGNLRVSKSSGTLPLQLILISFSNILCWIPTNFVFLFSLCVSQYPSELIIWTAVVIVPLNSIVNPLVFISTSLRSVKRQWKKNTLLRTKRRQNLSVEPWCHSDVPTCSLLDSEIQNL